MKITKGLLEYSFVVIIFSFLISSNLIINEKVDKQFTEIIQAVKVSFSNKIVKQDSNKEGNEQILAANSSNSKQSSSLKQKNNSVIINNEDQFINIVKDSIESGNDTNISVTKEIINTDVSKIIKKAIINYGYGGYISNFQYSIDKNNIQVNFKYNGEKSETISKINAVNLKAKAIVSSIIKPGMSDFEKEKAIHDYVVNNTYYDNVNYIKGTIPDDSYNAYGVFFNKVAVCEGYAEAIYRLLNEANIDNIVITGSSNNVAHSWNLVKIQGEYYHLDATFDDPISEDESILSYNYFNLTDEEISKDHSWNKEGYPSCISDKYSYFMVD